MINPAKETDLEIVVISFKIKISFGIKIWNKIRKINEVVIVETIFITKSLKELVH